jgi:hypothetical protein
MINQNALSYLNFIYELNMFLYKSIRDKCIKKKYITEYTIRSINEGECLICLEIFQPYEIVSLINCNHKYHTQCLYSWFEKKPVCPICNIILNIDLE